MPQSGYTPIQLYHSSTSGNTPSAGDLTDGELAINIADGIIFYKDSSGVVQEFTSGGGGGGGGGALLTNTDEVTEDYTVASGTNAFSVGPVTVASGITVTVSSGQRWVVI